MPAASPGGLNIPHYIVNFEREFQRTVVANFVGEYVAGRTPIPCSHCNSDLKFATLLDRSRAFGAEVVATGHYARIDDRSRDTAGRCCAAASTRARISRISCSRSRRNSCRAQASRSAISSKDAVRDVARSLGLPVADKPDSQEICFVPDGDYAAFIERQTGDLDAGGAIVNQAGRVLGSMRGVHRFTVGQRKGLGIAAPEPLYVLQLRPEDKTVVVGPRPELERTTLTASRGELDCRQAPPEVRMRVTAQIRHRHQPAAATVRALATAAPPSSSTAPVVAITPGQAVVFYDGGRGGRGRVDRLTRRTSLNPLQLLATRPPSLENRPVVQRLRTQLLVEADRTVRSSRAPTIRTVPTRARPRGAPDMSSSSRPTPAPRAAGRTKRSSRYSPGLPRNVE